MRIADWGYLFDSTGSAAFPRPVQVNYLAGFLNSHVAQYLIGIVNPTVHYQAWDIGKLPVKNDNREFEISVNDLSCNAKQISISDWDSFEISWDFKTLPIFEHKSTNLQASQESADAECLTRFARMKELEEENNRLFIEAYGLQDELSPEVPDDQITLYRPDRLEDIKRLISYAIGCVMGRYSLDKPGLIYAHSGNQGFDPSQYQSFRADDDGIIPLLDNDWGVRDDATNRIIEFVGVSWSSDHLDENLKFIADSLDPESKEAPRETIRLYLSTGFYKHHLSMYKKRPIYWLFSSGKQRAFQCLVYLHRYNEGTLSRMRTEYVIPLLGKMNGRLQHLDGDITGSSATGRRKLEKERDTLKKQLAELQEFDARLRHYADLRIQLDLDDGVKVNYGKFSAPKVGDILAEVKAICGTKDED